MECPFEEVGCFTKLSTNLSYQKHLSQNTEQHLQMVMNFHKTMLGSRTSNTITEEGIVSPLQKLNAVAKEVEFLDSVLESFDMGEFPAMECIKTHLKMPDLWINNLGKSLAFRLTNFSQLLQDKAKWTSPSFFVKGGYKMCVNVHMGGIGSGILTHISVALLHILDDKMERPISLPPMTGIKVELLQEVEDDEESESEEADKCQSHRERECEDIELTWKPASESSSPFRRGASTNSYLKRDKQSSILSSWHKPSDELAMKREKYRKSDASSERECEGKLEGVMLHMSEKYISLSLAQQYARQYNSLVFQVALCLV